MQTSNKGVIITLSAILVAAFFMPWVKFFVSLSAWDMLFGQAAAYIDTGFKYIGILIPVAGALIIYGAAFNKENYPLSKRFLFLLPVLTLIVIAVAIDAKIRDSGGGIRNSDVDNIIKIFGIGFWLTLIASVVLPFLNSQPGSKPPISDNQSINILTPALSDSQRTPLTISQPEYTRPQININLPKVDWNQVFLAIKTFLIKYKVGLVISISVLIVLIIVYNLFIKADPVKDGKNLAKNYCTCSEQLNKDNLDSMKSYFDEFGNQKFKSRLEARNLLNASLQENQAKHSNCIQAADIKYREQLADYNSKGGRNVYIFEQTYSSIISACSSNSNGDIVSFQNRIDEKIRSIIDPEPDIEKIKADLIGQEIIGWKFAYLSEYKNAKILNTLKSNDRIEYQVKFDLVDNTTDSSEHECEVMIVYLQSESGWYLSGVNLDYITYTYTLYPDRYVQITPFQNCKWNGDNHYKLSWKTSDWEYASETITDPSKGVTILPYSTVYFIKSLEGREVKIKFTYRSNS
jgi:hypothetical protein